MDRHRPSFVRVLRAAALGLLAFLPACAASQEWVYEKPRMTPAQLDQDRAACRKLTANRTLANVLDEERVDREAFNRCMQRRGYTVKAVTLP